MEAFICIWFSLAPFPFAGWLLGAACVSEATYLEISGVHDSNIGVRAKHFIVILLAVQQLQLVELHILGRLFK